MEPLKTDSTGGKGQQNGASVTKSCKKCGFTTLSFYVFYTHRRKCQGNSSSITKCCYCKRKFNFLFSYRQHRKSCIQYIMKKKTLLQKHLVNVQLKQKRVMKKIINENQPSAVLAYVCDESKKAFAPREPFKTYLKQDASSCHYRLGKESFSARKSFFNIPSLFRMKKIPSDIDIPYISKSKEQKKSKDLYPKMKDSNFVCMWCKNTYPSKEILLKHFKKNFQCAQFYFRQKHKSFKESLTARKSMTNVAKKSFSRSKHQKNFGSISNGSARKSLPNSCAENFYKISPLSIRSKSVNQCPVCSVVFHDSFHFFQHQKTYNHWGKAAKSVHFACKCPFCNRQFFHVRARNVHIRNHADKSSEDIKFFLGKTTCNMCSQMFVSETAKYQHIKMKHPKSNSSKRNPPSKHLLLPLVIKQKLKLYPNMCPICSKEFNSIFYRDKHFKAKHLDSELECKFCPLKYTSVDSLEYHMQETHYDMFKFECLVCKINLATAPHVVLHVTKVHSDKDPKNIVRCRVSENALFKDDVGDFMNKGKEIQEGELDKNKEFYCDICEITFQKKCGLLSHRQSKFHKDMLIQSLDAMHESLSNLPSPPRKTIELKQRLDVVTCNECLEDFATVKDFVPHRLSHFSKGKYLKINEFNLYKCEICGEVSNSHSKVQMHLFWHLQVESTCTEKITKDGPIATDGSVGQSVAKKSFSKSSESKNEVVIGGFKKTLFTCESCNIGFTTQAHYSLHVRKFCRVKNASKGTENEITARSKKEVSNMRHCAVCKCLYKLQVEKVHERFCNNSTTSFSDSVVRVKKIKDMERRGSVAACIVCSQLFSDPREFLEHMLNHSESKENSLSRKTSTDHVVNIALCSSCNCLFLTDEAQSSHERYCRSSSYHTFDAEDSKDILKPASELEGAKAVCIRCCLAFSDVEALKEHALQHQSQSDTGVSLNDLKCTSRMDSVTGFESTLTNDSNACQDSIGIMLDEKSRSLPNGSFQPADSLENSINSLRESFSKLLCILINDSDLMKQLGYGTQPVDDVLVNVLQQMGQVPILKNDKLTQIECLRKNISILLNFCLQDQIMELIGKGRASVDEKVIEALRMFSSEEISSLATEK